MNSVNLIGRLTRDPELKYTPGGIAHCSFTIAVDHVTGSGEDRKNDTDFIRIHAWRQTAENVAQYMRKGRQVAIENGRLRTFEYMDQDGNKHYSWEVVPFNVRFLDRAKDNGSTATDQYDEESTGARSGQQPEEEPVPF